MKIHEVMTRDPICCTPGDSVQSAAQSMRDHDFGSIPVISDTKSRRLEGIVTDRDICCRITAEGRDPKSAHVDEAMTRNPVTCGPNNDLEECEELMQRHQLRRIPIVDEENCCLGIVAQADIARRAEPEKVHQTVAAISKPPESSSGRNVA